MNIREKPFKDFYRKYFKNLEVNKVIDNTLVFKFPTFLIYKAQIVGLILILYLLFTIPINQASCFLIFLFIYIITTFIIHIFLKYTIYFEDNKIIIKRLFYEKKIDLCNGMEIHLFEKHVRRSKLDRILGENKFKYQLMIREKGSIDYINIFSIYRESDIEYAEEFINNFVNENTNS